MRKIIGPKMRRVAFLCEQPRAIIDVAELVGPHGSLKFGYEIVERAVRAGIVKVVPPLPGRRGMSVVAVDQV